MGLQGCCPLLNLHFQRGRVVAVSSPYCIITHLFRYPLAVDRRKYKGGRIAGSQLKRHGNTLGKYLKSIAHIIGQGRDVVQIDNNAIAIAGSQRQTRDSLALYDNPCFSKLLLKPKLIVYLHDRGTLIFLDTFQQMVVRNSEIITMIALKASVDRFVGVGRHQLYVVIQIDCLPHVHANGIG